MPSRGKLREHPGSNSAPPLLETHWREQAPHSTWGQRAELWGGMENALKTYLDALDRALNPKMIRGISNNWAPHSLWCQVDDPVAEPQMPPCGRVFSWLWTEPIEGYPLLLGGAHNTPTPEIDEFFSADREHPAAESLRLLSGTALASSYPIGGFCASSEVAPSWFPTFSIIVDPDIATENDWPCKVEGPRPPEYPVLKFYCGEVRWFGIDSSLEVFQLFPSEDSLAIAHLEPWEQMAMRISSFFLHPVRENCWEIGPRFGEP